MKLNITTETLRKALGRLATVPGVINTHLPTLAVIIEADDFSAKLRRTTGTSSVSVTLEAEVLSAGQCGVGYELLVNSVNAMAGADTLLESDEGHLYIRSGKTKGELYAYPESELIPQPDMDEALDPVSFATTDFLRWINLAATAAATEAKETNFAGVCLRVVGKRLTLFAVDRRRAHIAFVGPARDAIHPVDGGRDAGAMLPNESVSALRKLLPEVEARIDLNISAGSMRATVADVDALLPLATEQPPDMSKVMPKAEPAATRFTCNRAELLRAVRTAAPMGFQEQRALSVFLRQGAVEIVADNRTGGKLGHEIDATVTGEDIQLRANGQYLADFIETQTGEEIDVNYWEERHMLYAYAEDRLCMLILMRDVAPAA